MKKLFYITIIVSLLSLVAGFIVPPTGVIHPSVLTACGILSFLGFLCQLPTILSEKRKTTFKVGESSVTIEDLIKEHYQVSDVPNSHYSEEFKNIHPEFFKTRPNLSKSLISDSSEKSVSHPKVYYSSQFPKLNSNPLKHE